MSVCPNVSVLRFYGCCHPCYVCAGLYKAYLPPVNYNQINNIKRLKQEAKQKIIDTDEEIC